MPRGRRPKSPSGCKALSITLRKEQYARIVELADKHHQSLSGVIQHMVDQYLHSIDRAEARGKAL